MTVAVVTGGSRGIGAATARRLAADGWDVAIGYRQDHASAKAVVAEIDAGGRQAVAVAGDLTTPAPITELFDAAARLGTIGALVNNAGVVDVAARVDEYDEARLQRMFTVNLVGPFLCAGEAVRRMSTRHGGSGGVIVNVSSVASRLGSGGQYVDYAASKAGIDLLTVGLAQEVVQEGIRVNTVRPGIIRTDIHASGGQPDRAERLAPKIPMQRPGEPEEIAAAIAWLCSQESSYATGATLDVTGGR
ncbi:MAG TPA: SDR family oxidoreductase [Acidimicrobiales bacterium]|nr:SDR family oxidoreductase [Acidimicrobiales bacterium]